ncbi:MAG: DUF1858 domain-containing protein [Nanoarchaeota archaeon]|nr:DUF1858 domain-containing protein [Nanoarchaeota archaeon]
MATKQKHKKNKSSKTIKQVKVKQKAKNNKAKRPLKKTKVVKSKNNKTASKEIITKHMNINEIVSKYPNTIEVFFRHNFYCIGCQAAAFESLEQGAKVHGLSDAEIEQMVKELNQVAFQEDKFEDKLLHKK